jgi:hypothetical protein
MTDSKKTGSKKIVAKQSKAKVAKPAKIKAAKPIKAKKAAPDFNPFQNITIPQNRKPIIFFGEEQQADKYIQLAKDNNFPSKNNFERNLDADFAIDNSKKEKKIHNKSTGAVELLTLEQPPLLIQNFTGLPELTREHKNYLLLQQSTEMKINNQKIIVNDKDEKFTNDDRLNVLFSIRIRIFSSSNSGTIQTKSVRFIKGMYTGKIGDTSKISHYIFAMNDVDNTYSPYYNPILNEAYIASGEFIDEKEVVNEEPNGFIKELGDIILQNYSFCDYVAIDKYSLKVSNTNKLLNLHTMKLQKCNTQFSNISVNLFDEIINIDNSNENCVLVYLEHLYGNKENKRKINVNKFFEKYDTKDGIDTNMIIEFCKSYKIKCIAYDINKNIIASYYPEIPSKSYKSLVYIAYNNHMYPCKNMFLKSKVPKLTNTIYVESEEIEKKFNNLIKKNIIPTDIKISLNEVKQNDDINIGASIRSFINEDILYFTNKDYNDCLKLLSVYGIQDKITPTTSRFNVLYLLEKLYNVPNVNSFFPQLKNINCSAYQYLTTDNSLLKSKDIVTIDKNKCYVYCLYLLDNVFTFNLKTDTIIDSRDLRNYNNDDDKYKSGMISRNGFDNKLINECYFYMAKPKYSTILMHQTGLYSGEYLLYCINEKVDFQIIQEIQTKRISNPFKTMIEDLFNKTQNIDFDDSLFLKNMVNIWIGKFDHGNDHIDSYIESTKFCNTNEAELTDGVNIQYNKNYSFCIKKNSSIKITSRKLISIQIKNMSRKILYEKMKSLDLQSKDIIQINVDSLSFINRNNKKIDNIDISDFKGWKYETLKKLKFNKKYDGNIKELEMKNKNNENNILFEGYAGCGKSEFIKKQLIPSIIKNHKEKKYLILSPNHSVIEDYRKDEDNCNVIQKFIFQKTIPDEDIIIIDEIGLCNNDCTDLIYKLSLLGKQILSFGDFNQLLPVEPNIKKGNVKPSNQDYYLKYLYYQHSDRFKNKNERNDFTNEYYDKLIKKKIDLLEEIQKYMHKDMYSAECVICYTNEQCDIYNEKIMKYHNINFGDIGCKVMCKSNDLRKYGIYNNFLFTINKKDNDSITLNNNYVITKQQLNKYFVPAFARTSYNIQGKSLLSYYVPQECLKNFNDGRSAYTIVSRLKTKHLN